jgi:hypothetical protein
MSKIKIISWILVLSITGWIATKAYYFFFANTNPQLALSGIVDGGYYAGDVACVVNGEHPYKVKTITVMLDGKPLTYNFSMRIKLVDGTLKKNPVSKDLAFYVDNTPLQAAFVKQATEYRVFQGKTLHIQFQTNKPLKEAHVNVFSNVFPCFPEAKNSLIYETFIPIECEATPNEYVLTIDCRDYVDNLVTLEAKVQIVPFPFKKHVLHVDQQHIEREKEIGASQELLNNEMKRLTQVSPREKLWTGSFYVPTEILRISTEFGTIRTTQEKGRYSHKGVDIVNHPKSVIWAPQDGRVVIKDRYAYSGYTVVLDHGWGIFSLFYHLDSFAGNYAVGDFVKKGNPIGRLGKTGYASGYHLHWEMRINDIEVDPLEWTKPGF